MAIVTGMLVLGFSDNFIYLVAERMSVWQYHAVRAALVLPVMAAVMAVLGMGRSLWPKRPAAVLMRSVFSISALLLYFSAIPAVSVSLAAAGLFTSPIFVTLISILAFGERIGPRRIAGLVVGFAGVCLVLQIGTEPLRAMAIAPMIGGALYALNIIWTRRYCQQETAGALAFWNMSVFCAAGLAGMLATPWLAGLVGHLDGADFAVMPVQAMDLEALAIIACLGVAAGLGMVLLAIGYRGAESTYAALFDFSFLFWVPLFAWFIHGETLTWTVTIGMILIVLAGILALSGARRAGDAASA
ncbi:MAG: DMT family transporter [Pseudomonadota bacterium]